MLVEPISEKIRPIYTQQGIFYLITSPGNAYLPILLIQNPLKEYTYIFYLKIDENIKL